MADPENPTQCQQGQTTLDTPIRQIQNIPPVPHTLEQMPFYPGFTYLSWPSLFLLFLLLRAILVLELFFRAGPILMEVFSRAVVRRATLFPL